MLLCNSRKAFTMVELMVVISIVAVLATILFPVFAKVKDAAKKTNCISNLKQIALANMMYADDNDGYYVCQRRGFGTAPSPHIWWDGVVGVSSSVWEPTRSPLHPYMKNSQITACPSATDIPGSVSPTALGVNPMAVAQTRSVHESDVQRPSETILLGDAVDAANGSSVMRSLYCGFISFDGIVYTNQGILHARHGGDIAAVAWCDGHAKAQKLTYRPFDYADRTNFNAPAMPQAIAHRYKIGDLLKFPRVATTSIPVGVFATPQELSALNSDFYYFNIDKKRL